MSSTFDWAAAFGRANQCQTAFTDAEGTFKSRPVQDATSRLLLDMHLNQLRNHKSVVELILQHNDLQIDADEFRSQLRDVLSWTGEMINQIQGLSKGLNKLPPANNAPEDEPSSQQLGSDGKASNGPPRPKTDDNAPLEQPTKDERQNGVKHPKSEVRDDYPRQSAPKSPRISLGGVLPPPATADITSQVLGLLKSLDSRRNQKLRQATSKSQNLPSSKPDLPTKTATDGGAESSSRSQASAPKVEDKAPLPSSKGKALSLKRRLSRDSVSDGSINGVANSVRSLKLSRPPVKRVRTTAPKVRVPSKSSSRMGPSEPSSAPKQSTQSTSTVPEPISHRPMATPRKPRAKPTQPPPLSSSSSGYSKRGRESEGARPSKRVRS